MILNSPYITGSLTVTGNITASGGITISGSIASSSYATNAERLDNLDSTSFVFTSSYNTDSASVSTRVTKIEGNYATTGSNVFMGAQTVCANITSTGTIIAQTLNVQQVTSSIVYSSGSNIFGCLPSNVQQFTGSLRVTGSGNHWIVGGSVGINTTSPDPFGRGDALNVGISATGTSDNMALSLNAGASGGRGSQIYMGQGGTRHFTLSSNITETTIGTVTNTPFRINTCDTTRLYVSSSTGNIGVGTTSPTALLHNSRACNSETNIYIENTCTGTGAGSSLYLVENSSTFSPGYGQLTHFNSGYSTNGLLVANRTWLSNSGGELLLGTRSAHDIILHTGGFAAACERMRITSGGVVGINTNSPSGAYMLTLNGDSSAKTGGISFRQSGTDTFYAGNPSVSNTTDFELWNPRNGYLRLGTNNVERLRITSTGAVQNRGTGGTLVTQRLVGCTTAGSSGVDKEIAFVGFNHTINVKVLAYQTSDPLSSNVAALTQDIVTSFGNTCKINGGLTCYSNITGMSVGYGTGYKLYLNVTYSGTAPNVLFQIEGISGDTMTLSV